MSSEYISVSLRLRVQDRASGFCEYCRSSDKFSNASFHCDHIHPKKVGGKTELTNLAWHPHGVTRTNIQKRIVQILFLGNKFHSIIHDYISGNNTSGRVVIFLQLLEKHR